MAVALVPQVLDEYGAATRALLFEYLPKAEPGEHLYELCAEYPRRGGRAMRPSLCIAATRAFGRPLEDGLNTAVSLEMMHNAMLIHDDIEDESEKRRGRPALHVSEGVPVAINVGDTLSLLSIRPLLDNQRHLGADLALRLVRAMERMATESAEGQAMELQWRRDNPTDVSEADYLKMVLKKTCWLATILPLYAGALIGSGGRCELSPMIRFGFMLGAAFQIQDDLLNLQGDEVSYGKELGGDIYEGKRTLMLIRLFALATPEEQRRLSALLGLPRAERSASEVKWVREAMDHYDCLEYGRRVAQGLAGAARHECALALAGVPDSRDRRFIEALPTWVIERV